MCFTCVLDTSFLKGQLASCLTSSTVSCSQADSSWTPRFLPELRRLEEDEEEGVDDGVKTTFALGDTSAEEDRV